MNKNAQLSRMISLLAPGYTQPDSVTEKRQLLRALMNVWRPEQPISTEFLHLQDEFLQQELVEKGIVDLTDLTPVEPQIYLWQGDITRLKVGAIVNAANSQMLGCFYPLHACIDNAIHSASGLQLRQNCWEIMQKQGVTEPTGKAKITPGFNLPADYILHTVGPIISGELTEEDCKLLAECYRSCLELAKEKGVQSVAFCCISTGEFRFPNEAAAEIAVRTVRDFLQNNPKMRVIFNVFKEIDLQIYQKLLGK